MRAWYRRAVAPYVVAATCSFSGLATWRQRSLEGLTGRVLEIGFGAGANVPWYPATVEEVLAVEPSPIMRRRSHARIAARGLTVLWAGLDGARIDLPDGSVDHVVISFTLCTVSDPDAVLREAARVIAPGGELRVLEHGLAPDARIRRWQQRLNGVEQVLADGCQLVRDPAAILENSPWTVQSTYQAYAGRATPWSYFTSVRAVVS